jgi:hypothetical protein
MPRGLFEYTSDKVNSIPTEAGGGILRRKDFSGFLPAVEMTLY